MSNAANRLTDVTAASLALAALDRVFTGLQQQKTALLLREEAVRLERDEVRRELTRLTVEGAVVAVAPVPVVE